MPPLPRPTRVFGALALGWMALILWLSTRTGGQLRGWLAWLPPYITDLSPGHIALFGVLALWVGLALLPLRLSRPYLWAWVLVVAFGALDEWVQLGVPGRSLSLTDWLFDASGAALALYLLYRYRREKATSRPKPL